MTTHAQGAPAPKHAPGKFIQVTHDQLALPMTSRGAARNGEHVSQLQKWVLLALEKLTWGGKRPTPCLARDHQIADAVGLTGSDRARRNQVQIALNGRTYRQWNPATGKRDGEPVTVPGLCDLGFVEAVHLPTGERVLTLTAKWLQCGRFQVFNGGHVAAVPAIAGDPTTPPADVPSAPDGPPPHVAPEAAEVGTDPPAVDPPTAAPIVEHAPAPAKQPPPEVLADVLGMHYVNRSREDQASKFVQDLLNRSIPLSLGDDGLIRPTIGAGARPLSPDVIEVLRWLKPELVELLKARSEKSKPAPKPGEPAVAERPAPKVARPAEIRALIGKLTGQPSADDSDCRALALRLVRDPGFAHNDADPAMSEATYFGLARDTKRGDLGQVVMTEAFESACGAKVRNRGAMLVAEVKRIKAALRKPDREGGPSS